MSVLSRQWCDLEAAKRCVRAAFAGDDMSSGMREDLITRPAPGHCRRNVAHGARRHEYRGLLAEQIGHALAQQIDGRIVADLLVADLGPCHRLAHRLCRAGLGVRKQIDADGRCLGVARGRGVGQWLSAFTGDGENWNYLNRRFSRDNWSIDWHPISFIPRSISARIRPSARSTPAWPAAARG